MEIIKSNILNIDFSLSQNDKCLPKNIYAIKVFNADKKEFFELVINHNGYCPQIITDHEQSNFNEYLCNLEYDTIEEYFKVKKSKKPKVYYSVCEVITNENGELYRYTKSINS